MTGLHQIIMEGSTQSTKCYCNIKADDGSIPCKRCETLFHIACLNKRQLTSEAFTCLDCKVSSELVSKEQIYSFYEELK